MATIKGTWRSKSTILPLPCTEQGFKSFLKQKFVSQRFMFSTNVNFSIKKPSLCVFCPVLQLKTFFLSFSSIFWRKSKSSATSFYPSFLFNTQGKGLRVLAKRALGYLSAHQSTICNYSSWLRPHCAWAIPVLDKQHFDVISSWVHLVAYCLASIIGASLNRNERLKDEPKESAYLERR